MGYGSGEAFVRILSLVSLAGSLAGCATAPHQVRDRDDYLAEATRVYPGETRERVLKAAETVLKVSDPADFEFRDTLTGFTGLRRYMVYAVITTAVGREKWGFLTEPDPTGLRTSVSVSEEGTTSDRMEARINMRAPWLAFLSTGYSGVASNTCSADAPTG
jgi:hypothetical protein